MNNTGFFFNIGVIFNLAASAYNRSHSTSSEALTTILFSFIGLESFINTLTEVTSGSLLISKTPSRVITLGKILTELENSNQSLASKYQITRFVLTGELYDKGALPYQDFNCLIKIRNALIHSKPDRFTMPANDEKPSKEYPGFIRHLTSREIIPEPEKLPLSSWESLITVPEVAYWSYKTASEMIISIIEIFPECSIKQILNMLSPSIESLDINKGKAP